MSALENSGEHNEEINNSIDMALELLREEAEKDKPKTKLKQRNQDGREPIDVEEIIEDYNQKTIDWLDNERDIFLDTDREFLGFLKNFVQTQDEKEKQKIELKEQFFGIVMFGFFILLITPLVLVLSLKGVSQVTAIVSMVAILVELVSAIIVLPKIIAKYLFNKKEDEQMMQIIESMQKYNQDKHQYISKDIE